MTFEEWMKAQDPNIIRDPFSAALGWCAAMQVKKRDWLMDYIKHLDQEIARKNNDRQRQAGLLNRNHQGNVQRYG